MDEPEIVKELKRSEKLGGLNSKIQSEYDVREKTGEFSDDIQDEEIPFGENTADSYAETDTTHFDARSADLYKNIVELSLDSIVTVDFRGVITSCNNVGLKMMGYSRDELIGKHFTKLGLFQVRSLPKYMKLFSLALKGKISEPLEIEFRRKDGTVFMGEVRIAPLRDGRKIIGIQSVTKDITRQKKVEKDLKEKIDELESFRRVAINRELNMIELKQEINELCEKYGEKPRYEIV